MTYIVMWEFSKMMDPRKMSTLGFRDPFVAIPLGKRSIFGTYASTARVTVEPLRGTSFQNAH